ncbi:MAG: histidine kinase [Clostridia bacterium]|nr:histidine kinase [Clostridia bacterium]
MKKINIWKYIKNYKFDSLFFRNLILILILFFIPFIILSTMYYQNVEKNTRERTELENSSEINKVRDIADTIISEFDGMCSYIAGDSSVQMFMLNNWFVNFDTGTSTDLFRTINMTKYVYSYVDSIYIYSEYNNAVINENKMTELSKFDDLTWLDEYNKINERRGVTIPRSEANVYPHIISIIKPIYVDNEKKGAIILNLNSSKLYGFAVGSQSYLDNDKSIFLINDKKKIIMTKEDGLFGKKISEVDFLADIQEDVKGLTRKINNTSCIISSVPSEKFDFFYINISPDTVYVKKIREVRIQILSIILFIFFLSIFMTYFVAVFNYRPVTEIISIIDDPENVKKYGNMNKYNELKYISSVILERSKESDIMHKELEDKLQQLKKTQLDMLQAQINPHFLYNSLETINWMAVDLTKSNNNVSKAVTNLAKFFRFNVNNGDYLITIKEEMERTRYYLNILELRYADMFSVEWNISEDISEYMIVKICLQPIIENAVNHGLKQKKIRGSL